MAERSGKAKELWSNTFEVIEKIWAEDGIIRIQLKGKSDLPDVKGEGLMRSMLIKDAMIRTHELRKMLDISKKKGHQDMFAIRKQFEPVIKAFQAAILDAQHQIESPKDDVQARMGNFFSGKAVDGSELKRDMSDEDTVVFQWMTQYPTIEEHEARLIYRNKSQAAIIKKKFPFMAKKDDQEVKELIIKQMDNARVQEKYGDVLKKGIIDKQGRQL